MKTFIVVLKDLDDNISVVKIVAPNRQSIYDSSKHPSDVFLDKMLKDGITFASVPGNELRKYTILYVEDIDQIHKLETIY